MKPRASVRAAEAALAGLAALVGLVLVLGLAGCATTASGPGEGASGAGAPSPTVAAESVNIPVDGDDAVRIEWTYLDGADPTDPTVDVARKTTALILLAQGSPLWTDESRLDELSASVTDRTDASVPPRLPAEWAASDKEPLSYPVRVRVEAPEVEDGASAVVLLCVDASAFSGDEPVPGSGAADLMRLELHADGGVWRTTSYTPDADPAHCADF